MTLHDVQRVFNHWSRFPPARTFLAAQVSFKPVDPLAKDDPKRYTSGEELQALAASGVLGDVPRR